ncbi:MAG TPA: hypothetical protein VGZ29_03295 [Terriglobia bacterium]|nr:hypothetical protein [Terriglobia bacterium]
MKRRTTSIGCALALLASAGAATAQKPASASAAQGGAAAVTPARPPSAVARPSAPPSMPDNASAGNLKVSFTGGQLRIQGQDSTLASVLVKVAALTGVKIDIPAGANSERLPAVELGPGPARQVLAALLSGSNFDYLIAASDTDPGNVGSVVLMPRQNIAGSSGTDAGAPAFRGRYARVVSPPPPDEATETDSPPAAELERAVADAPSAVPASPSNISASSEPVQTDQALSPASLSNKSGLTTQGAMSPPSSLDSQTINQQLQQMYQQRAQMTQQSRGSAQPTDAASPTGP